MTKRIATGLEIRVRVHTGKNFDMSKMDKTDAVAFVGNTQNVYGELDKQSTAVQDFFPLLVFPFLRRNLHKYRRCGSYAPATPSLPRTRNFNPL